MSAPRIRIIRHETAPQTGSFEVRSPTAGLCSSSTTMTCWAAGCGQTSSPANRRWRGPRRLRGLNGMRQDEFQR